MSAFTDVTLVASQPAVAGSSGVHWAMGTAVGSASYDTGGSVIDMSNIFKTACYALELYVDNASYRCIYVPTASTYAAATGLIFVDDNNGTEQTNTTGLDTDLAVTHWIAWGTDA